MGAGAVRTGGNVRDPRGRTLCTCRPGTTGRPTGASTVGTGVTGAGQERGSRKVSSRGERLSDGRAGRRGRVALRP